MADCRACGAPIRWVDDPDGGETRLPLDVHPVQRGEGRYRVDESTGETVAVAPEAEVAAYTDHRSTCTRR